MLKAVKYFFLSRLHVLTSQEGNDMKQTCSDKYWCIVTEYSVGGSGLYGCDIVKGLRNERCTGS